MFTQTPKTNNDHEILGQHDKTKTVTHNSVQMGLLPGLSLTQENVLQLQKTIGNSAVMQLLKEHLQQPAGPPIQRVESEEDEIDLPPDDAIQMAGELEDEEEIQMKQDNSTIEHAEIEDAIQMKHEHTFENNTGMPDNLKAGLETLSGLDLSDIHVHSNSDKPAQVGALAYTQGTDIYVAPGQEKHLPHEGWHVVQQKQGRVQTTTQVAGMPVNDDFQLENEADTMGNRAFTTTSSNLAIIQQKRSARTNKTVQFTKYTSTKSEIPSGVFEVDLNPGIYVLLDDNAYGMDAKITFTPDKSAPDMNIIKMVQAVRTQEPSGKDIIWKDEEARREKTKTDAGTGITPGFFIDHKAATSTPRKDQISPGKKDPEVPSAYMEQFMKDGDSYHGHKKDKDIKEAKLIDFPSSTTPHIFIAETIAQADITGSTKTIGRCDWGFETEYDVKNKKWQMKNIYAPKFSSVESDTFKAALKKFNDIYRNPESELSPENVNKLIEDYKIPSSDKPKIKDKLIKIRDELNKNDPDKLPGNYLAGILEFKHGIVLK